MKKLVPFILILPLSAAPAYAQEASEFTGFRLEGVAGVDLQRQRTDGRRDGGSGFLYGVQAGYDAGIGGVVVGAEVELTDSSAQTNLVLPSAANRGTFAGRDIFLGARVGTPIAPAAMLYAKAGYTNTRFESRTSAAPGTPGGSTAGNEDGFRLGAGGEVGLGSRIYLKGEYRFSNYGNSADRIQRHQALGGLGIRF